MLSKMFFSKLCVLFALAVAAPITRIEAAPACVWKISGQSGELLYLGGSIHALRSSDYPLPSAYNRAFDASSRLVFEEDPNDAKAELKMFEKESEYPKGDSLRNHVDPRTYDYLHRLFKLMGAPEEKFAKYRPWALVIFLESPALHGLSGDLGVEGFLKKKAQASAKPISGLESVREHIGVFSGLTDRQAEALLLITFIPHETVGMSQMVKAWRRGDPETLAVMMRESFSDFPAMGERLLAARNRKWIPKIEGYLRSGQTYFVVAGAAHMGGADGVLALLRARGYKIEQL